MSALSSPSTSSTRPTSSPSASTTVQPCSITIQLTGSALRRTGRRRARPGPASPTGCVSESARRMLERAADLLLVEPREAAPHHPGGDAVAEPARDAEAEARGCRRRRERVRCGASEQRARARAGRSTAARPRRACPSSRAAASAASRPTRARAARLGRGLAARPSVRARARASRRFPRGRARSSARRSASGPTSPRRDDEEANAGRRARPGLRGAEQRRRAVGVAVRRPSARARSSAQFGGSSARAAPTARRSLTRRRIHCKLVAWLESRSRTSCRRSS